jgi:hypothetical protein
MTFFLSFPFLFFSFSADLGVAVLLKEASDGSAKLGCVGRVGNMVAHPLVRKTPGLAAAIEHVLRNNLLLDVFGLLRSEPLEDLREKKINNKRDRKGSKKGSP